MRLSELLALESVELDGRAAGWEDAVRLAGAALVRAAVTTDDYTDAMVGTVHDLGPYIVIAPGLALAHSRPSAAVHRPGLSWVRLRESVEFGHEDNDPVRLVIGLAAKENESHVGALAALARILADDAKRTELEDAPDGETVLRLLDRFDQEDAQT